MNGRANVVIREAPVVALLILVGVCLAGLGLILRDWFAIPAVAPLACVLGSYLRQLRSY